MANINDFKLVNLKSKKMFDFLNAPKNKEYSDVEKSRLGFYHLVLENVTGIRDIDGVQELIIDTDYNKIVHNKTMNDLGMDAVNIIGDVDAAETIIQLFNFKFRGSFNEDKTKEETSLSRSTKFLEFLLSEQSEILKLPNDKVRENLLKINSLLNSNTMCNIKLYMVSNEANGFSSESNQYMDILEKSYGMRIINISLDDIIGYFVSSRSDKECKFIVDKSDFLSFEKDDLSTQKSYVTKMSLIDLIRITCNNTELNKNYNIENDMNIRNAKLDFSLLYDNVRGYLGETDYNKNIKNTLKENYKEFFMLNNGLTITSVGVDSEIVNSGKRYLFTLKDFQIVNGGQTIRSIYNFLDTENSEEDIQHLRETFVLVRIFKISAEDELKNRIAEYTNSQNAIASSDLKSVDKIQIQIESYFKEEKILYNRKAGQLGEDGVEYEYRISKEKLAQILYSAFGFPDRASNQKKRLFQEYYTEIFKGNKFSLENAIKYCKLYYAIDNIYKSEKIEYNYFEQKIFYIVYLVVNFECEIVKAIEILEKTIEEDKSNSTPSRLLLKNKFKDELDKKFNKDTAFDLFQLLNIN